jgi:hypothetical protein
MVAKSLLILVLFAWTIPVIGSETESKGTADKLTALEELIANAELETAECQMWTGWHFPGALYSYLELARECSANGTKIKNSRKFYQNLQSILSVVNECIDGQEGYFAGNCNDVWVNPVPAIPECAIEVFKTLRTSLETELRNF